jgi:hypothetical protein
LEIPRKASNLGLGWLTVSTFSDAWISRCPWQNSIAETTIGFVLRHLASKMAEIAFLCQQFQEKQGFQVWGWLMVNTSKKTFSDACISRSPQWNAIAETIILVCFAAFSFKTGQPCICALEIPRKTSNPGLGLVDSQHIQRHFF